MADRAFVISPAGGRVTLISRDPHDPDHRDDRVLGTLPERFRVIYEVSAVLRASGVPPERWVDVVGRGVDAERKDRP